LDADEPSAACEVSLRLDCSLAEGREVALTASAKATTAGTLRGDVGTTFVVPAGEGRVWLGLSLEDLESPWTPGDTYCETTASFRFEYPRSRRPWQISGRGSFAVRDFRSNPDRDYAERSFQARAVWSPVKGVDAAARVELSGKDMPRNPRWTSCTQDVEVSASWAISKSLKLGAEASHRVKTYPNAVAESYVKGTARVWGAWLLKREHQLDLTVAGARKWFPDDTLSDLDSVDMTVGWTFKPGKGTRASAEAKLGVDLHPLMPASDQVELALHADLSHVPTKGVRLGAKAGISVLSNRSEALRPERLKPGCHVSVRLGPLEGATVDIKAGIDFSVDREDGAWGSPEPLPMLETGLSIKF
jgi:hypothetical protein